MIDKLMELAKVMEMKKRDEMSQPFPRTHFFEKNNLPQQLEHMKQKVAKLEALVNSLDSEDEENQHILANAITKVMYSGFTMLNIMEKNFPYYAQEVAMEYMVKGYYSHAIPEDEREILIETWKAKKNIEKLEKMKRKKHGTDVIEEVIESFVKKYKGNPPVGFEKEILQALKDKGIHNVGFEVIDMRDNKKEGKEKNTKVH